MLVDGIAVDSTMGNGTTVKCLVVDCTKNERTVEDKEKVEKKVCRLEDSYWDGGQLRTQNGLGMKF